MNRLTFTTSRFPTSFSSPLNFRIFYTSALRVFVYGSINKLKSLFSSHAIFLTFIDAIRKRHRLELLVAQRTRDLLESQIQRNIELERFAEFGRICANLMHEVASPLTAASINLDLFDGHEPKNVASARKNLQQVERYLNATRLQLKSHSSVEDFSLYNEYRRLLLIMGPIASQKHIKIIYKADSTYHLIGDPVKFNQLLANLISNSIDAYDGITLDTGQKKIYIRVTSSAKYIKISVIDWGIGIEPEALPWLFKPFYTTKSDGERGTGIGLTMVKRVVEEDYNGSIKVISSPRIGTRFVISLRR